MGGHGDKSFSGLQARLNILPQKRWNVYGRENRLKVKRDEEQAAGEQAEKDAAHRKAESEYRHAALLKRAQARAGATENSGQLQPHTSLPDEDAIAASQALQTGEETHSQNGGAASKGAGHTALSITKAGKTDFDVLGFLRTEPSAQGNPEAEEAKKQELRKRGEAKTQTSDAKFDAQFAFGHGLTGQSSQPWYAGSHVPMLAELSEPSAAAEGSPPSLTAGALPLLLESKEDKASRKVARKRAKLEKKLAKLNRREGVRKKKKKQKKEKADEKPKGDLLLALRKEREEREAVEREKARRAVLEASGRLRGEPEGRRYHSGFGTRKTGFSSR